ncbi:hypothetical protein M5K25_016702 [Dendrobium thyrsiflorum]|uniref:Uncharacterized protein n=1 Tax=Dendrobium thyrsiflorum TaxID=117978 RepID=A0ABD0USK3_DENTH
MSNIASNVPGTSRCRRLSSRKLRVAAVVGAGSRARESVTCPDAAVHLARKLRIAAAVRAGSSMRDLSSRHHGTINLSAEDSNFLLLSSMEMIRSILTEFLRGIARSLLKATLLEAAKRNGR